MSTKLLLINSILIMKKYPWKYIYMPTLSIGYVSNHVIASFLINLWSGHDSYFHSDRSKNKTRYLPYAQPWINMYHIFLNWPPYINGSEARTIRSNIKTGASDMRNVIIGHVGNRSCPFSIYFSISFILHLIYKGISIWFVNCISVYTRKYK